MISPPEFASSRNSAAFAEIMGSFGYIYSMNDTSKGLLLSRIKRRRYPKNGIGNLEVSQPCRTHKTPSHSSGRATAHQPSSLEVLKVDTSNQRFPRTKS